MAKDPVCGMDVDEATAKHITEYNGQTYYFCAPGVRKRSRMIRIPIWIPTTSPQCNAL